MKLSIGCGNTRTPGFIHADINADIPDLDLVCEMDDIPVEDDTYSIVLASHCIEHVGRERAKRALVEWLRVLQRGGLLIVDTPNMSRNVGLYHSGDWMRDFNKLLPAEQEYCSLAGEPNRDLWLNFKLFSSDRAWDTHFWNATPDLLVSMFQEAGFSNVRVKQTEPSLIVEGRKP